MVMIAVAIQSRAKDEFADLVALGREKGTGREKPRPRRAADGGLIYHALNPTGPTPG
jgi:hypothetical protein